MSGLKTGGAPLAATDLSPPPASSQKTRAVVKDFDMLLEPALKEQVEAKAAERGNGTSSKFTVSFDTPVAEHQASVSTAVAGAIPRGLIRAAGAQTEDPESTATPNGSTTPDATVPRVVAKEFGMPPGQGLNEQAVTNPARQGNGSLSKGTLSLEIPAPEQHASVSTAVSGTMPRQSARVAATQPDAPGSKAASKRPATHDTTVPEQPASILAAPAVATDSTMGEIAQPETRPEHPTDASSSRDIARIDAPGGGDPATKSEPAPTVGSTWGDKLIDRLPADFSPGDSPGEGSVPRSGTMDKVHASAAQEVGPADTQHSGKLVSADPGNPAMPVSALPGSGEVAKSRPPGDPNGDQSIGSGFNVPSAAQTGSSLAAPPSTPAIASAASLAPGSPADAGAQVTVHVAQALASGGKTMTVELHPAELGRVEIRFSFHPEGLTVRMTLDRPETFAAFSRDRAGLEQQLAQAGVDLAGGGLDLRLGQQSDQSNGYSAESTPRVKLASSTPATAPASSRVRNGLIDILA